VWLGIAVAMSGGLLLAAVDLRVSGEALVGDLLAVAGGAFAALYMTAGSEVRRSVSTTTYTLLCYGTTALLLLAVCVVARLPLTGYDADDWLKLLALTLGAQLLGHSLFNRVLKTVGPTTVSMLILLEIPGAALVAAAFLGQRPPLLAVPAFLLLVAGLALVVRAGSRATVPAVPVE
jgi:drug/metabolite transporter (DMT)-like permease